MERKIDYSKLTIPRRGDSWEKIKKFAMLINGYEMQESFEEAAKIANEGQIEKMNEQQLHVTLFFEYRRYNHFGYDPDKEKMEHIYKILDRLKALIEPK